MPPLVRMESCADPMELVMGYIDDPRDRDAISRVCRKWYQLDCSTRKHLTIPFCYTTTPERLRRRFPELESLKLKGKPRAAMFNLIAEDWGGYAGPWVNVIAEAFKCLKSIHFRRMIVQDADIRVLVRARAHMLVSLKLDMCTGFSTDALALIAHSCRCLSTLFLEQSCIRQYDGEWLHELAVNNTVLEILNFFMTGLRVFSFQDLVLIAKNCKFLTCLKISECGILKLMDLLNAATALEEFGGGLFNDQGGDTQIYHPVHFPPTVSRLGLCFIGRNGVFISLLFSMSLKKLDLKFAFLNTEDHCRLLQRCPHLEVLEVTNVIGDRGLEIISQKCKKLKRLRIERGADGSEDGLGKVTQRGLRDVAWGCLKLGYLAVYVSDITNAALECVSTFSKNLRDFRLVLLDKEERITDLPLDDGVRALLRGCTRLRRFALYLRPGGLTDVGLRHIGEFSRNIRYMLLGFLGRSDDGLLAFSRGCPDLQKLELRGCCGSERALALAVTRLPSLRYMWVQGYGATPDGRDLLIMARNFWNIELVLPQMFPKQEATGVSAVEQPAQILAYYSLAGKRTDSPGTVVPIHPA